MDNASSHQELDLANVKIVKLPANCRSVLRPMDQGLIQALKLTFYNQQPQCIISEMENSPLSGTYLLKEVTVLDTIYWINRAWNDITSTCIKRCFEKFGFDKVGEQPLENDSDNEDDGIPPRTVSTCIGDLRLQSSGNRQQGRRGQRQQPGRLG